MSYNFIIVCEAENGAQVELLSVEPCEIGSLKNGLRVIDCRSISRID